MQVRTIELKHVQLALFSLRLKRYDPSTKPLCALSNGATWKRCHPAYHDVAPSKSDLWTHPPLAMPMITSITPAMVERVRMNYGLDEVKKTWGTGYKALLAQLKPKGGA